MAIVRWEPVRELNSIQQEMNRLFDTVFEGPRATSGIRRWIPSMDLVETDDQFVLKADLPGLEESDVKIEVQDNVLTLSGERNFETEAKKDGFVRVERASGSFHRSLTLPKDVDVDAIAAAFDKGVLEVRIPKPEERKPRRVEIAVGDAPKAIEGTESNGAQVPA
jgi:HSP20 family protein